MIANYTYTDARIFDPDPALNNNRVRDVPFNAANLWTRYNFIQDECQTVGAAIGLVHLGERPANLSNTLDLPSFVRWDAGAYYCRGPFRANVYLENLSDIRYAAGSIDEFQIFPGAPFNVRASLSYLY